MECYNCGYQLSSDAERCPRCGQRFKPRSKTPAAPARPSVLARLKGKLGKKQEDDTGSAEEK